MNNTKAKFKEKLKGMSFNQLIDEQSKLKRLMMIARMEVSRQQNPMDKKSGLDKKAQQLGLETFGSTKIVKWKHAYISQLLHNKVIK